MFPHLSLTALLVKGRELHSAPNRDTLRVPGPQGGRYRAGMGRSSLSVFMGGERPFLFQETRRKHGRTQWDRSPKLHLLDRSRLPGYLQF